MTLGCVMFEIITLRPLFPGSNELDQISKIHEVLGTPSPSTLDKFQQYEHVAMDKIETTFILLLFQSEFSCRF